MDPTPKESLKLREWSNTFNSATVACISMNWYVAEICIFSNKLSILSHHQSIHTAFPSLSLPSSLASPHCFISLSISILYLHYSFIISH